MKSPLINKKVILTKNLYAAWGGGIAIHQGGGSHGEIKLHPTQNANAVHFPINNGTNGHIVDEYSENAFVVRLEYKESLSNLYSYHQVNIIVTKGSMGGFFKYV